MTKIIKIENTTISVGMPDGTIKTYDRKDFNFMPYVGAEVEIYTTDDKTIISEVKNTTTTTTIINNNGSPHKVNKLAYCLLAFFLGGLGIHKFYAGYTGYGILYLIFCWTCIPAIISFVEFIIGVCKTADSGGNIYV